MKPVENKKKKSDDPEVAKDNMRSYAYYTGLGFQMIATIGVFTFIGYKLDAGRDKPIFTAIFALVGVCVSLIGTILSITKRNKRS